MTAPATPPEVPIAPPGTLDDRDPSRSDTIRARALHATRSRAWLNAWADAPRRRHLTVVPDDPAAPADLARRSSTAAGGSR